VLVARTLDLLLLRSLVRPTVLLLPVVLPHLVDLRTLPRALLRPCALTLVSLRSLLEPLSWPRPSSVVLLCCKRWKRFWNDAQWYHI
jgi:hypothetical protein